MAIARFPSIVIDCPDPGALATFYGVMLDWKADVSPGWAEVRAEYGQCISFQQVADYTPGILENMLKGATPLVPADIARAVVFAIEQPYPV